MHRIRIETKSVAQTHAAARMFWRCLKRALPFDHASVIALRGDLGAGKTTFMQGFARAMGVNRFMTSPTFLLMRSLDIPGRTAAKTLVHVDSWRIETDDLEHLGIREAMQDPQTIVCIEWAERVKALLPRDTIWLDFKHLSRTTRLITIRIP